MHAFWKVPRLALMLLCWTLAIEATAQHTGVLRGVVTDQAGAPLPGVTVTVEAPDLGAGGRGAVTDQAGQFHVAALPAGADYTLRFKLSGFASVVLSATEVRAGQATSLKILLPPEDQLRERVRYCHYSLRTGESYVHWIRACVRFSSLRHPRAIGSAEQARVIRSGSLLKPAARQR